MESALRMFVPLAIRSLMQRIGPRINAAAGQPVDQVVDLNPAIAARIAAGEPYDIGLTNPHHADMLAAEGRLERRSVRAFGAIPLAIGRRAGGEVRVATDADAISALLRRATSVGFTAEGTSGRTYLETLARMGLADDLAGRSRPMAAGQPAASAVAGTTELAVVPLTTILSCAGLVPVAIFPASLGADIALSVFLGPSPAVGASAVLDLLTARDLDGDLAAAGVMRPQAPVG